MKKNNNKIVNQASYEAYLNKLFVDAVNTQGTPTQSLDEILLSKALSYGRAVDDAKADVKRILNVRSAVEVLQGRAAASQFNHSPPSIVPAF